MPKWKEYRGHRMTIENTKAKSFWVAFESKKFDQALQQFDQLNAQEKAAIFAALYQKSGYQKTPHSISVLFRELHEGKNFNDFHGAHFPAQEHVNTIEQSGEFFHQFFPAPIRVINAVNMQNPKEIVSIGLHWLTEEAAKHLMDVANDPKNSERAEAIAKVADKTKSGIYKVESDDNLGVPF